LTDEGKDILANRPEEFRDICGDYFIEEYRIGALLLMSVNIVFDTAE